MILLCELSLVYKPIFLPNSLQAVDHALNCLRPFITMSIPSQPFCCSAEGVCHLSMFFDICCHFSRTPVVPVTYNLTAPHSLQAPLSWTPMYFSSHHIPIISQPNSYQPTLTFSPTAWKPGPPPSIPRQKAAYVLQSAVSTHKPPFPGPHLPTTH